MAESQPSDTDAPATKHALQNAVGYEINESDAEVARQIAESEYKGETDADKVGSCVEQDDLGCYVVVWGM